MAEPASTTLAVATFSAPITTSACPGTAAAIAATFSNPLTALVGLGLITVVGVSAFCIDRYHSAEVAKHQADAEAAKYQADAVKSQADDVKHQREVEHLELLLSSYKETGDPELLKLYREKAEQMHQKDMQEQQLKHEKDMQEQRLKHQRENDEKNRQFAARNLTKAQIVLGLSQATDSILGNLLGKPDSREFGLSGGSA